MTAVQDLVADPTSFIRHNLLKIDGSCNDPPQVSYQPNGTIMLTLEDMTNDFGGVMRPRNRKGIPKLVNSIKGRTQYKATRLYVVRVARPTDLETFAAYICPYQTNASRQVVLGVAASLMFTAEMTGCSFGIGIPNAQGGVLVMHSNEANLATEQSTAPQAAGQLQQLQNANANALMLQPGQYRTVTDTQDTRATTIGILVGGDWQFWYQNFDYGAGVGDTVISVARLR